MTENRRQLTFSPFLQPGRGALSIFVRRGCAVFRVSFSPIFSRSEYQKKAVFLEPVVKTYQKGKFC